MCQFMSELTLTTVDQFWYIYVRNDVRILQNNLSHLGPRWHWATTTSGSPTLVWEDRKLYPPITLRVMSGMKLNFCRLMRYIRLERHEYIFGAIHHRTHSLKFYMTQTTKRRLVTKHFAEIKVSPCTKSFNSFALQESTCGKSYNCYLITRIDLCKSLNCLAKSKLDLRAVVKLSWRKMRLE